MYNTQATNYRSANNVKPVNKQTVVRVFIGKA